MVPRSPARVRPPLGLPVLATRPIVLPARGLAPKTAPDDPVDYYYRPLTGSLYRGRLALASRLLGHETFDALLEVGYGSGIFLPELARRSSRLVALDLHDERARVEEMLRSLGVTADLRTGSLFEMPFGAGEFDALVCLSVLEHVRELDAALDEIERVLAPGGIAVLGFPVRNVLTDGFFRLVGYDPREIHPSSHRDILAAVQRHSSLTLERPLRLPPFLPQDLAAYVACRLRAPSGRAGTAQGRETR